MTAVGARWVGLLWLAGGCFKTAQPNGAADVDDGERVSARASDAARDAMGESAGSSGPGRTAGPVAGQSASPASVCDAAEGGADPGAVCRRGAGVCQREGTWVCRAGQLTCGALPGEPGEERCGTGMDEDCDGAIDEAPAGKCCRDDDCPAAQVCGLDEQTRITGGRCVEGAAVLAPCRHADLQQDWANCGTCGHICEPYQHCQEGTCVGVRPGPPPCAFADLQSSESHCGACDHACANGHVCVDGICEP